LGTKNVKIVFCSYLC